MSLDVRSTEILGLRENQMVAVLNSEEDSSAGVANSHIQTTANEELPEEEFDSMEARKFGERLCEKTASDWSAA